MRTAPPAQEAPAALEITAFINLIVVLVPFLLSTAVFSKLSVMELSPCRRPPAPGWKQLKAEDLQLEVVLRADGIEVGRPHRRPDPAHPGGGQDAARAAGAGPAAGHQAASSRTNARPACWPSPTRPTNTSCR
jgi:hypothetical protein